MENRTQLCSMTKDPGNKEESDPEPEKLEVFPKGNQSEHSFSTRYSIPYSIRKM